MNEETMTNEAGSIPDTMSNAEASYLIAQLARRLAHYGMITPDEMSALKQAAFRQLARYMKKARDEMRRKAREQGQDGGRDGARPSQGWGPDGGQGEGALPTEEWTREAVDAAIRWGMKRHLNATAWLVRKSNGPTIGDLPKTEGESHD